MPSLYELTDEIRAALGRVGSDGDGDTAELTDSDAEALDSLRMAFEDKADQLLRYRVGQLAAAEGIDVEIRRLTAMRDGYARRAEWVKAYLFDAMRRLGVPRIETKLFKAWVQASAPSVVIDADADLPDPWVRVRREPDRAALLAAAKAGDPLPTGVTLHQGSHLRVK